MVLRRLMGGVKSALGGVLTSRGSAVASELAETNKCLTEIGEKRKKALKRKDQRTLPGRRTISSWEEDDRYAEQATHGHYVERGFRSTISRPTS